MERPPGGQAVAPGARGVEWSRGGGGEKSYRGRDVPAPLKGTAVSGCQGRAVGEVWGSAGRSPSQSLAQE